MSKVEKPILRFLSGVALLMVSAVILLMLE